MSRPAGTLGALMALRCRTSLPAGLAGAWQGQARGTTRLLLLLEVEGGLELTCADHGERTPAASRAAAGRAARTPDLWCSGCRAGAAGGGAPWAALGRGPILDVTDDGRARSDVEA